MKFDKDRMKDLRSSKKLSQEDLADKTGYYRQQIATWEKGTHTPGLEAIGKIAKALDVPASFLIVEG